MSEPENFLSRWSRRKLEAEQEIEPASTSVRLRESEDPEPHDETALSAPLNSCLHGNERTVDAAPTATASEPAHNEESPFDLSTLPSLESITAETDIRMFLQKGVPSELTRAALRRAWAADPAIRDFIEMAENQWDFVTGSDLPGFGPLQSSPEELRRMVADLFGEGPKATNEVENKTAVADSQEILESPQVPQADESPQQAERQEVATVSQDQSHEGAAPTGSSPSAAHRNEVNIASQQDRAGEEYEQPAIRRFHGRALPQ